MYEEHNEETDSHAPDQRQTAQNRDWLDIIGKVGTPLAALIAALAAYYIAQPFQREITSVTLRNGREQAESKLRSDMFSSLIGPIVGSDKDPNNDIQAEREKVLVELLALNFHEYFEFF
ncbi:MAG: hypothetical protein HZC49_03865 [Nitrospirae bacterium]|nr:hypothetical protein [Nitrospirota bacterium]